MCKANLREVHQSLQIYRLDNAGWLPMSPQGTTVDQEVGLRQAWYRSLFPRYVGDLRILVCPEDPLADTVRASLTSTAVDQELPARGIHPIRFASKLSKKIEDIRRHRPVKSQKTAELC